jgi:hypothetical protein
MQQVIGYQFNGCRIGKREEIKEIDCNNVINVYDLSVKIKTY